MTDPTTTVYASKGSVAFHINRTCPARERGADLNDWDVDWVPGCRIPRLYAVEPTTIEAAMGEGKMPCGACLPDLRASWYRTPSENDFGHQPEDFSLGQTVCARCHHVANYGTAEVPFLVDVPILWPCTSAVVLGLVPRTEGGERL